MTNEEADIHLSNMGSILNLVFAEGEKAIDAFVQTTIDREITKADMSKFCDMFLKIMDEAKQKVSSYSIQNFL